MAKNQQPTPKQNFMQTLLIMVVIFMGFQIFQNATKQAPDLRRPEEVLTAIQTAAAQPATRKTESDIKPLFDQYKNKLNEAKLPPAEHLKKEIEAAIILADVQYRSASAPVDGTGTAGMNAAYHTLLNYNYKHAADPVWTTDKFAVDADDKDGKYGGKETTGAEFYNTVVTDLSQRNKNEMVIGLFPGYQIIDSLVALTGRNPAFSYTVAAFILALIVRALVFPLAQKQIMFGRQMSQLIPLTTEIKEKFKDDPQQLQIKTMELYKEYGINPMAGCFPALLQMPLFLLVYQFMLHYQLEFQKGTFLWINPNTSAATNGFVAPNLGHMDYILLVVYGISMITSTLLMPVSDPTNAKQGRLMGIGISVMFTVMMFFWPLPSAFVLYWIFTNLLSTLQSLRAYRLPLPPLMKVNTPAGGVYPMDFLNKAANGKTNGHTNGQVKTGKPVKHKPKKRK